MTHPPGLALIPLPLNGREALSEGSRAGLTWIKTPAPRSSATSGKLLNLSVPPLPHVQKGDALPPQGALNEVIVGA